ncbi:hypothetical protein CTI12_AA631480 [Artemisia annua]|uniref:Uncharacterized protein n=1 Tax=Artemisia annua TaxID=35608 RepID=A0A2U1K8P4_ARTAN|nr:hypothetical protein CTI12_AA631480 [Artemisia annua]
MIYLNYLQAKPEAAKWRTKPINHYNEMLQLFGKDRAIGVGAETTKERRNRININEDKVETIEELDQLLEANEVCFENIDSGESPHATSATTHTQVKIPNATKIKSRKRKLEEDDAFTSKIMSAMKNLSDAIDRSTKVMESSRPHVYSENEIYQELEHMGLEPLDIPDAYLFLVERPDNVRALFGCPLSVRKTMLSKMMGLDE